MKRILIFILFISLTNRNYSQTNPNLIPKINPVSPEVASLIKYADVPVSNYNGTTQYGIPIYEINEGDLKLPISLNYSSNGLKVDEEASNVGLGWTLNYGGVIQQFRDLNNMNIARIIPYSVPANIDPNDETFYDVNVVENKYQSGCAYPNLNGVITEVSSNDLLASVGYKHVFYVFNFAGHSGKFIKDTYDNYVTIDRSNIRFENLPDNKFKAISTDGTQYFFEIQGHSTTERPGNASEPCVSGGPPTIDQNQTYYLSKVISPTNREINFIYTQNIIQTLPQLTEWRVESNVFGFVNNIRTLAVGTTIKEFNIQEINTEGVKVQFLYNTRIDMYNAKRITQINIFKQGDSQPIKSIHFNTSYFSGDSTYGDYLVTPTPGACGGGSSFNFSNLDNKSKRLRLDGINFKDSNSSTVESFNFEYFTTVLPYKTSRAKDIWGYFNGENNTTLIPNVANLGYYDNSIPVEFYLNPSNGHRKANQEKMKFGLLKKVTQPTKGFTEIDYEINQFWHPQYNTQIVDVEKFVQDLGQGINRLEFTVPDVGFGTAGNIGQITTHVICTNPSLPCTNPIDFAPENYNCFGYNATNSGAPTGTDNRLYALIEKKNTNGTWSLVDDPYDRFNAEMMNSTSGTCGLSNKALNLSPGIYRITANYPDNMSGVLGGPWSFIKIKYKDYNTTTIQHNGTGAGLRVKSIKDYSKATNLAKERYFTYSIGKLMSKPIFTSVVTENTVGAVQFNSSYFAAYNCLTFYSSGSCWACYPGQYPKTTTIHSNPIVPSSNSADGYLVGYNEVKISYGQNDAFGQEIYKYNNEFANIFTYQNIISSIKPTPRLMNGRLIEKIVKKKSATNLITLKVEKYNYKVSDYKSYWDFIPQYYPRRVICNGAVLIDGCGINFNRVFMHFMPIQVAVVKLKDAIVEDYFYDSNDTFLSKIETKTEFGYNSKHQVVSEKFTNSKNQFIENKTYFPFDLVNTSVQNAELQQLINLNKIDVPVKIENLTNGIKTSEQTTKFANNSSTSNLILPKEIHTLKGNDDIDLNSINNRKVIFDRYDLKGNITQYSQENGSPVSVIWGINKTKPIAVIENLSYSELAIALGVSVSQLDNYNEANIAIIDSLRTNSMLTNAKITTYNYIPLIGVSSIKDAKGDVTTYHYDYYGRLQFVKDKNEKILKENEYHYRP